MQRHEPDLSFIESDISLDQVKAIETKRLIAFINCFLTRTTRFLNDFAARSERGILAIERQMERIEIALTLLEAKLDSVPGLAGVLPPDANGTAVDGASVADASERGSRQQAESSAIAAAVSASVVGPASRDSQVSEATTRREENTEADYGGQAVENGTVRNRDDPVYAKYFRMLKMGVVLPAVRQKMIAEGCDPSVLDNPDASSPNATAVAGMTPPPPVAIPVPVTRTSLFVQPETQDRSRQDATTVDAHGGDDDDGDEAGSDSAASSFSSDNE